MVRTTEYIAVEKLNVSVNGKLILKDVEFSIKRHQTACLIGESGSGKTTLANLFVGANVEKQQKIGRLWFEGRDLLRTERRDWKAIRGRKIAYVAQNPMANFNRMQTIESHAREIYTSHLPKSLHFEQTFLMALEEMNFVNGEKLFKKYPFQLSGGMLQRVMIAIFLMLEPDFFILDEPTSALDSYNTKMVLASLQRLKEKGKTMLIITHDYMLLNTLIDFLIVLKDGSVVESGQAQNVISNPQQLYTKELLAPRKYYRSKGSIE